MRHDGAWPRGSCLEAFLAARGLLAFEQDREPFAMLKASRFRLLLQILESGGHAGKAELVQSIDGRICQHF